MAPKQALVILAKGTEEMEAVIVIDILRRAKIDTVVAGLNGADVVECSRGVLIKPDKSLQDAKRKGTYDVVILPGGLKGSKKFAASPEVKEILAAHEKDGKIIAAICAAPTAFVSHGIVKGKKLTSHPFEDKAKFKGYDYQDKSVVIDGNLITSQGPGTAFEFALAIVGQLVGDEIVTETKRPMLLK